jgi:hypothetical protein
MHSGMGLTKEKRLALSNPYQNASRRSNVLCANPYQNVSRRNNLLCQTHTRMHRGETTCFVKPIPECIEEKRLALSNPYQNASRRNDLLCQTHTRMYRGETTCFGKPIPDCIEADTFWYGFDKANRFSSIHSGMGLTKQVVSPRCIMVWVWQSKSFLLDAFWYGFEEKRLALSNPYQNVSRRNNLLCQTHTIMHRGETTCFVKPIPECIEEKRLALSNPYQNVSRRNNLLC